MAKSKLKVEVGQKSKTDKARDKIGEGIGDTIKGAGKTDKKIGKKVKKAGRKTEKKIQS